ncbi:NAD+ synthase [Terriglobus saanensis]|uniref:Glutamine-dependent NAD(+) synthetase n=1 Tax=Terriglobus saanensis (strain ATCC BAA-1853 / DSM 23119 / SP1PR4) TaxID=401053 RepID=E8V0B2_TERSS|nr:NAD+ synthase [Terriglobus saanensis]ADV83330.1 NAD+ synthetase [Terriglobus saanensis SP1PR4]
MKIALAQINPTVGDFAGNVSVILDFALRASRLGAELVIFPELAVCGYPPADLIEKKTFLEAAQEALAQVAASTEKNGLAILCGSVLHSGAVPGKTARNVAALCQRGKVSFIQQKMLLPFYDVFDEQRYFEPAVSQSLIEINGVNVAISICEDAWNDKGFWPNRLYASDPIERLMSSAEEGNAPRLLLNISASPFWRGKLTTRRKMLAALAQRYGAVVAMVNQVGGNDSLVFDGSSFAVAPDGRLLAQAKSFEEDLILFDTSSAERVDSTAEADDTAQLWDALVLGTRDYVRKCGFKKAIVGLSGGIDSAVVAAIAVDALGAENVKGIGMPSEYSSSGSVEDARALAENLGIAFDLFAIRSIYDSFTLALAPSFQGTPFGLAEENLQPRIRGTLLMALSNKTGALVLTTGNKSEMAVGYCTLYGDMVGALAVIGDVVKMRVYDLARYANRKRAVIPADTLTKPPSAELRPDQKDTDSLPPYEVLDPIVEAYVERYESVGQIAETQGVNAELVRHVVQLIERSEYKRQQAAPVLKVTQKSFGPGRRFPIAAKVQI